MRKRIWSTALAFVAVAALAGGQNLIGNQPGRTLPGIAPVQYLFPQQVRLAAGKPATVALHFRVIDGMHINSHTPHNGYLIPTVLSIPASSGAKLDSAVYPPGADITLPIDPKTKLSVYTGDFTIEARIVVPHGNHLVQARLHYQACNMSQCLPPRDITAAFDVIAQ